MRLIKLFVLLPLVLLNTLCLGKSQKSIADSLSLIEKIYLHTDRSTYYTGDDVWFKAYLIDALDHSLTNHSRNLHVELISPALKIISNRIIRLDSGLGNGDFKLPPDISSGKYKIRASIVAFKAVNNLGKGCDVSDKILNNTRILKPSK
jgi:uncharacterized protein YfaS (alpha-2-macroglobulin family)